MYAELAMEHHALKDMNAATESFFQLLRRARTRRRIYSNHDEAGTDVFHNPTRRHGSTSGLSPIEFERQCALND